MNTLPITYSCSPRVSWAVDAGQIIVVDEQQGRHYCLRGVEAAVWDWLTLAYPYPRLLTLLANLLAVSPAQAAVPLHAMLRQWADMGLLAQETRSDG